jgi:hypothetical protein
MFNRREKAINWNVVPNFSPNEFSEDQNIYANADLIYSLQATRNDLNVPIYPSPAPGALARTTPRAATSMHYADPAKGILSRAVDFFVEGNPVRAFFTLLGGAHFVRIGIYFDKHFDGQQWVMFHADRSSQVNKQGMIWYTTETGEYRYPARTGYGEFTEYLYRYRREDYNKRG